MTNNLANNKKIAKNTFFLYIRMAIVLVVSIYATREILNILGVEDYGIYNIVWGFVSIFAFVFTSLTTATQRYYNYYKAYPGEITVTDVYNSSLRIQVIISLLIFIVLEGFGFWYINNVMVIDASKIVAANWIFQSSVISLLVSSLMIPYSSAIISYEYFDYYAYVNIGESCLKLVSVLVLPFFTYDKLIVYGFLILAVNIIVFLLYYICCKVRIKEIKFYRIRNRDLFRKMLSFSKWILFDIFAYLLKNQGSNLLLNAFFGPLVNAARGVAVQVANAINGFSQNLAISFKPQLVESYAGKNYSRTVHLFQTMSKISVIIFIIITIPVLFEIDGILNLWLKGTVPEYTSIFIILLLADTLISTLIFPITQMVLAVGDIKRYEIITSCIVLLSLPIAWIFLKLGFSPNCVFIVNFAIMLVNLPVALFLLHRIFNYSYMDYIKSVIIPCCALLLLTLILPAIMVYVIPQSILRIFLTFISSIIASLILAYYIGLTRIEKEILQVWVKNYFRINKN